MGILVEYIKFDCGPMKLNWRLYACAFICGGVHSGRVEPPPPRHGDGTPGSQSFIGIVAQAKVARLASTGASVPHTPSFIFNLDNATGTQRIGV